MVHSRASRLDETFFALSDPTRRAILARLAQGEMSVSELAEPFSLSGAAISKHLRVLKRAGLLTQRRAGLGRECTLQTEPIQEVIEWLQEYRRQWTQQLDSFAQYAERLKRKKGRSHGKRR